MRLLIGVLAFMFILWVFVVVVGPLLEMVSEHLRRLT